MTIDDEVEHHGRGLGKLLLLGGKLSLSIVGDGSDISVTIGSLRTVAGTLQVATFLRDLADGIENGST